MTALDHELMSRICPLEYIYHVFKVKGAMSVNLSNFTNRFNQVRRRAQCVTLKRAASDRILACSFKQINYWVVTEIVYTRVLSKRVQTIKKFIKLAAVGRRAQPAFCSRAER